MRSKLSILAAMIAMTGCSFNLNSGNASAVNVNAAPVNTGSNGVAAKNLPAASPDKPETKSSNGTKCDNFSFPDRVFIKSQTFAFDHEPFENSCFVTFANKDDMVDARDVPRGSTFHIFQGNKDVFEFPDAFGGQPACWVEAIGFEDLNADGQMDVIMAGKCLAAKDSYPANAVFVNNGRGFTTDDEANEKLQDLKSVNQIKSYVKKNLNQFFE